MPFTVGQRIHWRSPDGSISTMTVDLIYEDEWERWFFSVERADGSFTAVNERTVQDWQMKPVPRSGSAPAVSVGPYTDMPEDVREFLAPLGKKRGSP